MISRAQHDEAFHDGMEAAYGNLEELLGRLHSADLHLIIWREGPTICITVDGEAMLALEAAASTSSARMTAGRVDEALAAVEDWCNEWLPTGHELEAGAEADPDVADTAWAIIAHHRQHRTAG